MEQSRPKGELARRDECIECMEYVHRTAIRALNRILSQIQLQVSRHPERIRSFHIESWSSNYKKDKRNQDSTYGVALPGHLGYNEHSLTVYLLPNHAKNLSTPKPYPPCSQVPYLRKSVNQ